MINITLPEGSFARRLSFYLAMEEYVARQQLSDDAFFLWQVEPSVIFGRNQVVENEVNMEYCREHGIQVYQRKSGGGCVYADRDNLMLSYVTKEQQVGFAFNRFVNMLLLVLRKMGVEATGTRHNDIMISDRKVCGTACRVTPYGCVVHSTMLYDTNMQHMLQAITPSQEKLAKNGVESVRQRITLLKDYTSLTLEEIKILIIQTLCDKERLLTDVDVSLIEEIENNQIVK
jgi:lipoic acid synthetase/lipoate-protein ligase A